jgi:hypothetical protein
VSDVQKHQLSGTAHRRSELFCLTAYGWSVSDALRVTWSFQLNISVSLVFPSLIHSSSIDVFPLTSSAELQELVKLVMDALVAQYSRPASEDEGYSSEDQQELARSHLLCRSNLHYRR